MLEKKREEIRKKMRRISVEKQFQDTRQQIYRRHALQPKPQRQQWTRMHVEVENCFSELHQLLKAKKYNSTGNHLEYLFNQLNQTSSMSAAILSNCDKFCLVFRLALKDALEKQKEQEIQFLRCGSIELAFVAQLLRLMGKMTYYEFQKDKLYNFIDCFWGIFREDIIYINLQESKHILQLALGVIYKMLEPQDQFIFKGLKEIGLGSKLATIAKSKSSKLVTPLEASLLKIIQTYLYQQSILYANSQVCQINGIHIIGLQNNEKQILMAYCLAILQSRSPDLNLQCINSLIIILKKYEYLGSTICIEQIKDTLFEIIRSQNRKVKSKAMELMDVIVYSQDKEALNELLKGMKLPNILQDILIQEMNHIDDQSSSIIQSASVVICNLTLVTNKNLRKQLMVHPIWDLAYQNIYAGSPLLPLVTVFEYYFDMVGRSVDFRVIESYLAAVSHLDMQLIDEKISHIIHKTIRRLYLDCKDFWPESMEQRLVALIKDYHMDHIIDELMPQEQGPL